MKPPLVLRLIRLKEATGQTVCLLTNQGPERLSDALAARIYKLRWGIEVMWRDLKQTMSHHKTLGTSPGRVQAELDWGGAGRAVDAAVDLGGEDDRVEATATPL